MKPNTNIDKILTNWGVFFYILNGIFAIFLLLIVMRFNLINMDILTVAITVGVGYPMLMRSRLLSVKMGTNEQMPLGFELLQQGMEKLFKYKMSNEHSYKYTQICSKLQNYEIDKLKNWAIDTIQSSELENGEKNKYLQLVDNIMFDPTKENDKKKALSGVIVGIRGISYAKKLCKTK